MLPQEPSTTVIKQISLDNLIEDPLCKFLNYAGIDDIEKLSDLLDLPWIMKCKLCSKSSSVILAPTLESTPTLQPKLPPAVNNQEIHHIGKQ